MSDAATNTKGLKTDTVHIIHNNNNNNKNPAICRSGCSSTANINSDTAVAEATSIADVEAFLTIKPQTDEGAYPYNNNNNNNGTPGGRARNLDTATTARKACNPDSNDNNGTLKAHSSNTVAPASAADGNCDTVATAQKARNPDINDTNGTPKAHSSNTVAPAIAADGTTKAATVNSYGNATSEVAAADDDNREGSKARGSDNTVS